MKKFIKKAPSDYIERCIECGEDLIKVGHWVIHPDNQCSEDDGVKTVIQHRKQFDKFQAKYNTPEGKVVKLIKEYNKLVDLYENTRCRRISKWFLGIKQKVANLIKGDI